MPNYIHRTQQTDAVEELHGRFRTLANQWAENMDAADAAERERNAALHEADKIAALAQSYADAIEKVTGEKVRADFKEDNRRKGTHVTIRTAVNVKPEDLAKNLEKARRDAHLTAGLTI